MSPTITNLSFHGQRELSTGLQLQQKVQNHTAISNCCLTRSQVGEKAPSFHQSWTANIQVLSKNCYDRVKPIIQCTKLKMLVFCQSFCVRAIGVRNGGRFGQDLKNSGKTSRYVWASFLSRTIALQNSPIRFPQSGAKVRENWKVFSP